MARGFKGFLEEIDRIAVSALYGGRAEAAEQVVKDMQDLGPAWTGQFSNSWVIETSTGQKAGGGGAQGEPVSVKAPKITGRDVRANVLGSPFKIGNEATYADVACDLREGVFKDPGVAPIKPASRGTRSKGIRGEPWPKGSSPGSEGPNRSTAEQDWFVTYVNGGNLQKTVDRAMKTAESRLK